MLRASLGRGLGEGAGAASANTGPGRWEGAELPQGRLRGVCSGKTNTGQRGRPPARKAGAGTACTPTRHGHCPWWTQVHGLLWDKNGWTDEPMGWDTPCPPSWELTAHAAPLPGLGVPHTNTLSHTYVCANHRHPHTHLLITHADAHPPSPHGQSPHTPPHPLLHTHTPCQLEGAGRPPHPHPLQEN